MKNPKMENIIISPYMVMGWKIIDLFYKDNVYESVFNRMIHKCLTDVITGQTNLLIPLFDSKFWFHNSGHNCYIRYKEEYLCQF